MFGAPTGALRFPATPEDKSAEGDSTVSYEYHHYSTSGGARREQFLMLTFDAGGVLRRVDFDAREHGNDQPPPAPAEKQEPKHWGAVAQPK